MEGEVYRAPSFLQEGHHHWRSRYLVSDWLQRRISWKGLSSLNDPGCSFQSYIATACEDWMCQEQVPDVPTAEPTDAIEAGWISVLFATGQLGTSQHINWSVQQELPTNVSINDSSSLSDWSSVVTHLAFFRLPMNTTAGLMSLTWLILMSFAWPVTDLHGVYPQLLMGRRCKSSWFGSNFDPRTEELSQYMHHNGSPLLLHQTLHQGIGQAWSHFRWFHR